MKPIIYIEAEDKMSFGMSPASIQYRLFYMEYLITVAPLILR